MANKLEQHILEHKILGITSGGGGPGGASYSTVTGNAGSANTLVADAELQIIGSNGITTVAANSSPDSLTIDGASLLPLDGSRSMTANLSLGGFSITNVNTIDGRDVSVDGSALDAHIADTSIHFAASGIDHGILQGLLDDDHTQYIRVDGTRAFTGTQSLGNNALTNISYADFQLAATPLHSEGRLHWDDDNKTLLIDTEVNNLHIRIGQTFYIRVRNTTGSLIPKGKAVYINGSSGQRPTIALSDADVSSYCKATIGLTASDIGDNNNGYVISFGLLKDLNTNSWSPGAQVWISSTPGELTNVRPVSPSHAVSVGHVVTQNATTGSIHVNLDLGAHINELHDTLLTGLGDNHLLQYNSTTSLWENQTPSQIAATIDHTTLSGLMDDDHTQYALLAGRSSSQTLNGGTTVSGILNLSSTSNVTKGQIFFGSNSVFNEANNRLGIGTTNPELSLHVFNNAGGAAYLDRGTTSTNTTYQPLHLRTISSGDMVDDTGVGIAFSVMDNALVQNTIAHINAVRSGADNSGALHFATSNAGAMTTNMSILPNGKVGIGISVPQTQLDVLGQLRVSETAGLGGYIASAIGDGLFALSANNSAGSNLALHTHQTAFAGNTHVWRIRLGSAPTANAFMIGWFDVTPAFTLKQTGLGILTATPVNALDVEGAVAIGAAYSGTSTAPTDGLIVVGSVGIGTASPSANAKLDVTRSDTSTTIAGLELAQDSTGDAFLRLTLGVSRAFSLGIDNSDSDKFKIGTAANATSGVDTGTLLTIQTDGSVGIGTTAPSTKLHVTHDNLPIRSERTTATTNASQSEISLLTTCSANMVDGFGSGLTFHIQDTAAVINPIGNIFGVRYGADNSGKLSFYTYNAGTPTEKMGILPSGYVGIGVTAPETTLHVETSTYPPVLGVRTTTSTNTHQGVAQMRATTSGDMIDGFGTHIDFSIKDNVTGAQIARIGAERAGTDDSGDLYIDTNNAGSFTEKFRITKAGNVRLTDRLSTLTSTDLLLARYNTDIAKITTSGIEPVTNLTYDLGSPSYRWREVYVGSGSIDIGGLSKISAAGDYAALSTGLKLSNSTSTTAGVIRWSGTQFEGYNGTTWKKLDASSADVDHGTLQGLADDDHSQYLLTNGTRVLTGNWSIGSFNLTNIGQLHFTNGAKVSSPADGQLLITDNAGSGSPRLLFGGTTNAYPMFKRSGTEIHAQLADDSGNVLLVADGIKSTYSYFILDGGTTGGLGLGNTIPILWASTSGYSGAKDLGLNRQAANILKVTNGSTGLGSLVATTLYGSVSASGNLTLVSSTDATKGKILFGNSAYDEVNNRLGVRTASPNYPLEIAGGTESVVLRTTGTGTGGAWKGRIIAGGATNVFVMGEYSDMAWLGGHSAALSAWSDFYINPDGTKKLFLGGQGGYSGGPIMTLDNNGSNIGVGNTSPSSNAKIDVTLSNTSTILAGLELAQDSTGDSFMRWALGTSAAYSLGIDNSDADKFKLGYSTTVVSGVDNGTLLAVETSGTLSLTNRLSTLTATDLILSRNATDIAKITTSGIEPVSDLTYDLGSPTYRWREIYVGSNSLNIGGIARLGAANDYATLSTGLKLGNSTTTTAGTIRWNATNFEGYDGSAWRRLDIETPTSAAGWTEDSANNRIRLITSTRRVGIGIADALYRLHIKDTSATVLMSIGNDSGDAGVSNAILRIATNQSAGNYAGLFVAREGNTGSYLTCIANGLNIGTTADGATPGLFYGTAGGVAGYFGVGTIDPSTKMQISGNATGVWQNSTLSITNTGTNARTYTLGPRDDGSFWLADSTAGLVRLLIDSSGRISVGSDTSASYLLDVKQAASGTLIRAKTTNASTYSAITAETGTLITQLVADASASLGKVGMSSNHPFVITTNNVNRVYIDAAGNVGLGNIDPVNKLDVKGSVIIGTSWAAAQTAPTNGLAVQGYLGVGTYNPGTQFVVENSTGSYQAEIKSTGGSWSGLKVTNQSTSLGLQAVSGGAMSVIDSSGGLRIRTGNVDIANFDTSGRFQIGSAHATLLHTSNYIHVNSNSEWPIGINSNSATNTHRNHFVIMRSVNNGALTNGSLIGGIAWAGHWGSGYTTGYNGGCEINCFTTQAWSANAYGSKLVFRTNDNSASSPTDRMEIQQNGLIKLVPIGDPGGTDENGQVRIDNETYRFASNDTSGNWTRYQGRRSNVSSTTTSSSSETVVSHSVTQFAAGTIISFRTAFTTSNVGSGGPLVKFNLSYNGGSTDIISIGVPTVSGDFEGYVVTRNAYPSSSMDIYYVVKAYTGTSLLTRSQGTITINGSNGISFNLVHTAAGGSSIVQRAFVVDVS